jgi:hypothetical protein
VGDAVQALPAQVRQVPQVLRGPALAAVFVQVSARMTPA